MRKLTVPGAAFIGPFAAAVLCTAAAASIVQTQFNLAALAQIGARIAAQARLLTTLEDLGRFAPVMAAIAAGGLLPALALAHYAARRLQPALRMIVLALAGMAGLLAAFTLLGMVTPMPALVEATAHPAGLFAVCLCGAAGGAVYGRLTRPARTGGDRMLAGLALIPALLFAALAPRAAPEPVRTPSSTYAVRTIAAGLAWPASLALLPNGRALVAERAGRLLAIDAQGAVAAISLDGLPPLLRSGGAGLIALAVDPDFARNGLLYLSMGYGRPGANGTRLVRARLDGRRIADVRILFDSSLKASPANNGGALAFLPDGSLLLSVGDGHLREHAQERVYHRGKLIRVPRDGGAPELYSLGHRNPQGLAYDAAGAAMWMSDHGPRGGDEINLVQRGANYGWPIVTRGIDYSFARVSPFSDLDGYAGPAWDWTPSIAPSGLAVYSGAMFPGWQGDLLVAALKGRALRRLQRDGDRIVGEQLLLSELGERLRDVKVAPDGAVYVLTDGAHARLLRLQLPGG